MTRLFLILTFLVSLTIRLCVSAQEVICDLVPEADDTTTTNDGTCPAGTLRTICTFGSSASEDV
jgi:hypothetical protein